jgi:hypothetical protein
MRPIDRVLARLPDARKHGKSWRARCPEHQGKSQTSLAISEGDDGRALLKCHGGCATQEIVNALELEMANLFDDGGRGERAPFASRKPFEHSNTSQQSSNKSSASNQSERSKGGCSNLLDSNTPPSGLTLAQYADAKKLPLDFLRGVGLSDMPYQGSPAIRMPYFAEDGTQAAVRFRLALAGEDRFRWKSGAKPCLYGLWRLRDAQRAGYLVIVEGESDCHTLWYVKIPAAGLPGADSWREEWAALLDNIPTIYIVIEPDQGGQAIGKWLSISSMRERAQLLKFDGYKDPSALYLADPEQFCGRWTAAMTAAIPWTTQAATERQEAGRLNYDQAKTLLEAPELLQHIGRAMQQRGYAGDVTPAKQAYVAMTSRLLERPQNLAFVAQSAAGKNRAVDEALALMPPEAVYLMKAGSPRALIYNHEDFQHRVVVVAEADSIPDDGPAASAIRSIAEDNHMAYDVVEKHPRTGHFETRHIVKPGPTGLITTSTKSLGTQLGTRVLEVSIPDDPAQTRKVLKAHARTVTASDQQEIDLGPYIALQRYLAAQGEQRVIIPFAEALAELVPAHAVRMRRDFRQLLTCIQTIALLYQCQQRRRFDGIIIATIEDYKHARELLAPIFDGIAAEGVTAAIRQTVEEVQPTEEVSEAELARRLQVSKSTVHYRVGRALSGGWLVNNESRKGYPAKLARGAPLPEVKSVLPTPEDIEAKINKKGDRSNGSNRTPSADEPFEQDLKVSVTSKTAEVFEGSNHHRDEQGPPSPPLEEEIVEWTA